MIQLTIFDFSNKDYIVEDGSYLRLRDITLGYNLPMNNVNTLRSLRLYISAQNLITITNYSGLNPEVSSRGQSATNFGVDLGGYPISTIYRLGINIGL
jgi:TonB-dependent starch-binding outer membrane protein SusC